MEPNVNLHGEEVNALSCPEKRIPQVDQKKL